MYGSLSLPSQGETLVLQGRRTDEHVPRQARDDKCMDPCPCLRRERPSYRWNGYRRSSLPVVAALPELIR